MEGAGEMDLFRNIFDFFTFATEYMNYYCIMSQNKSIITFHYSKNLNSSYILHNYICLKTVWT